MWRRLHQPDLGLMKTFSDRIASLEERRPGNFPVFRPGVPLSVFSDYAGSHRTSSFDAYAFLIVQPDHLAEWDRARSEIRSALTLGRRRMAYKGLSDEIKLRALRPWLHAFDFLPGLLVTILIEKSLGSLFPADATKALQQALPEYSTLKRGTMERSFRVCHFLSVLIAGLSFPGQDILWITDQDEIAANDARLRLFTTSFGRVCSMYLEHDLGHLRIGTTKSDDGSLQLEDLTSLPDLVAGALSELHSLQLRNGTMPETAVLTPVPDSLSPKALQIVAWLAARDLALRRMVFGFWPATTGGMYVNKIDFFGSALSV